MAFPCMNIQENYEYSEIVNTQEIINGLSHVFSFQNMTQMQDCVVSFCLYLLLVQ